MHCNKSPYSITSSARASKLGGMLSPSAFATLVQRGAGALLVGIGAYLASKRESIITLASRYAIPAMYPLREEVVAGGLMSYGGNVAESYRLAVNRPGLIGGSNS